MTPLKLVPLSLTREQTLKGSRTIWIITKMSMTTLIFSQPFCFVHGCVGYQIEAYDVLYNIYYKQFMVELQIQALECVKCKKLNFPFYKFMLSHFQGTQNIRDEGIKVRLALSKSELPFFTIRVVRCDIHRSQNGANMVFS